MKVFEIQQWTSMVSDGDGPFVPDNISGYVMPEEAEAALDERLAPYENSSICLDRILNPLGGGHWCFVCLDKEYPLAGHITEARRSGVDLGSDVGFTPLARTPNPVPPDYYPAVGMLVFGSKTAAETMASRSRLFEWVWDAVEDLAEDRRWLVMIDALEQDWVETNCQNDHDRWVASRR